MTSRIAEMATQMIGPASKPCRRRVSVSRRATAGVGAEAPVVVLTLHSERLAPLLDGGRDALVQPRRRIAVPLHLTDRAGARRRRHVGADRVVEGLDQRVRVLLRVDEAL